MRLESIALHHFRCIPAIETVLPPGAILIEGDNARGKTSLLEAIFYLVTGRSFRTRYDNDCLTWASGQQQPAAIRATVRRAAGDTCRLAVTIGPGFKNVQVDGKPIEKLAELWGKLRAVLFTPDDLILLKGPPAERRRYLDVALSQVQPSYLFHLQRYNHALRQRNALLKHLDMSLRELRENVAPYETQLAEHGIPVLQARCQFLDALEPRAARLYDLIIQSDNRSPREETLRLEYIHSVKIQEITEKKDNQAVFHTLLSQNLEEDRRRGQTNIGPHRDDFILYLGGKPARDFASQGQVRSAVLALRLAEVHEMENRTQEPPLLLLDDLASELDPIRKQNVLQLLKPEWQIFLTSTRRDDFPSPEKFARIITLPFDT